MGRDFISAPNSGSAFATSDFNFAVPTPLLPPPLSYVAEDGSLNYRYEALLRSLLRTFRSSFVAPQRGCFAGAQFYRNEQNLALRHEAVTKRVLLRVCFVSLRVTSRLFALPVRQKPSWPHLYNFAKKVEVLASNLCF